MSRREARWLAGNQVIPIESINEPATLAIGSLAVFAVDRETSERLYLFGVQQSEPLFPLQVPADAAWDIAAVPLETSCLHPATERGDWEEVFALENWLRKIGEALARFSNPGTTRMTEPERRLNLKPGERVAVERGLVFVHLSSGGGLLLGVPTAAGESVAIVPGMWLEAAIESEWRTTETGSSAAITKAIEVAGSVLFRLLDEAKARREATDRDRFAVRAELDRRASEAALGRLAGIGDRPTGQTRDSFRASGDRLLDVVRAAAAALGVEDSVRAGQSSGRGPNAVSEIAQASGLRTRSVLLEGNWWRKDNGPLVAHRSNGDPVALIPRGRSYEMFDPAAGTRTRIDRATAGDLNAFAQMLYRPLPDDLSTRNLLRYALMSRRGDARNMIAAGIGAAILGIAAPQGIAILISQAIPDNDRGMVWQIGLGLMGAALGAALLLFTQAVAVLRAQSRAFLTLQTGVWDYLLRLSPAFFRGFTAGQLRLRADAITRVNQLLTTDAFGTLSAAAASLSLLLLIFWYSVPLGLIALAAALATVALTWQGARQLFRVQTQWQEAEEVLSGLVLQSIGAVSKLRVSAATDRAFAQWAQEYSHKQKLSLAAQRVKDRMRLFNLVLPTTASALAFLWLLGQSMAVGPFLACNAAMMAFLAAVTSASDSLAGLVLAANLWRRLDAIFTARPEVDGSKAHPGRLRGAIAVDNLTFRYRSDGPMILDGVSIRAEPGECIALTGPSGCGKSTLLNLVLRFETPHSGAIYLDGRELSSLDITSVRRQIGVVTQDGRIMAGSLFENISAGSARTMDEAWEAAAAAGLADDIRAMPMGMHTVVSEGGGNLSGGQRQRVLIARALILKPAVLIFDEATSALDNRTQAIVTASLNRLNATRILVAHRLSTIRRADRIYVMEKGRIVQEGRYDDLANSPGLFARLTQRQNA
ncbi:MAG TPA: NHLP bacteriocin export ABC transporter permease/ATPase subunit [Bryobacteraceae bacterium]|nr:NHLP bacteriocin export ABC transporter permease/ATPase subunit [Bryobacteraceae bacterium]